MAYENPITRAREKDATSNERRLGQEMAESLKDIIAPFFLRRTKADVAQSESNTASGDCPVLKMPKLTRKNDLIVWVYLSDIQQSIYRDFIQLDDIKELLMTNRSPLVALTVLKKICDHPRLLPVHACMQLGLDFGQQSEEVNSAVMGECAASRLQYVDVDQLIAESGKLQFLSRLLSNLRDEGHRTLFFSQSRRMLDVVQKMARKMHHKVLRMDGTVRLISERNELIDKFQTDSSYTLFLLTTQVGGEGLTLTAADRVVIFDPSWNPARDSQAVDRVFRIGQNRNVVVYRLITCGTVEEKIYRRQVFKDSITRQTTGKDANPMRYFTKQELRELFVLDDSTVSQTQQQLAEIHAEKRHTDTQLDQHIAYLHSLPMYGISDHDLMFSEQDVESDSENTVESGDYVQARVREAQKLINSESSVQSEMNRKHGGFVKPPSPLKPKKPTQQLPRPLHLPAQPPHVPTQPFTRQDEFSMAEAIGHVSIHDSDEEQAAVEAEEVVVITDACTSINQTPDTSAHDVRRPGVGSRQISTEINGNMSAEADSSSSDEEVVMIDANTSCQQANQQLQTPEVSSPFTNGPSASSRPAVRRHTDPTDVVREASTIAETDRTGATSVLSTPAVRRHTDPSDVAREASTAAETDRSGTAEIIEETDSVPTLSFVSSFLQDVSPAQHAEKQTPGDTAKDAVLTNQTGSTPLSCRRLSSHRAAAKRRSSARLSHPVSPYVTRQEELIISPLPKRPLIQLQESPQVVNRSRTSFYTATESLNDDDDVVCASPVLTEKSIFHRTRRFVEDSDGDESPVRKPEQTFVAATPDSTDEISPIATDLRRPSDSIGSSGTDRLVIEDSLVESEVEELSRSRCEVEDLSRSEELSRSRRRRSTALQPIILDESDSDQSHDSASDGSEDDGCEEETDGEICTDGGESDSEVDAETEDQGSYSDLPPLQQLKYSRLLKQARQLERSGDVSQSLKHVLAALEICSEPETQAFALRLHKQLKQ